MRLGLQLVLLLASHLGRSTVAAVTVHDGHAGAGNLLHLQEGLQAHRPARHLHQATPSADSLQLQQAQQRMMAVPFATPRSVLALGHKGLEADTLRNWHLLARKLATPGENVTVVAFGGSVTAGYIEYGEAWKNSLQGSWVEALLAWLKASFPGVRFSTLNMARSATDVIVASTCWYQAVPQDADLILVEYSLNGCIDPTNNKLMCHSMAMPRVAGYEALLRRLIRTAPNAALMAVAMFSFQWLGMSPPGTANAAMQLPNAYYSSGEELHTMIAQRYGAPVASIRGSMYDLMYNDTAAQQLLGATRATLLADGLHPTAAGFKVYGDVVAYSVRQTLAAVFASGAAQPSPALGGAAGLPHAISPAAARQDVQPWCREGLGFQPYAACAASSPWPDAMSSAAPSKLQSGEAGCYWKDAALYPSCPHTNCHTHGYFMKGAGQALTIRLDTSLAAAAGSRGAGASSSVEEAGSSASNVVQFERRYLVVTYIQGKHFSRGGDAVLACVRGCRCRSITLALQLYPVLGIAAVEVTPHTRCTARITIAGDITTNTATGGDEFFVTGAAVVPFSRAVPHNAVDTVEMAGGRALGGQLPFSWP
uniref:SGNH hydrolase-type esterase domain-containing protein n=1 Tax=Tetradesmus obliquus TaxID=3088 RepID=A0A383VWE2_TETOB|eukprot:jgi/Sobl393_1/17648/SZX69531.1